MNKRNTMGYKLQTQGARNSMKVNLKIHAILIMKSYLLLQPKTLKLNFL